MADDELASVNILVMGKVQGVFFRASALEQAQSMNLTGWVKNLSDGSVEVVAEGTKHAVERLVEWCHQGPPMAKVEHVSARYGAYRNEYRTFVIA